MKYFKVKYLEQTGPNSFESDSAIVTCNYNQDSWDAIRKLHDSLPKVHINRCYLIGSDNVWTSNPYKWEDTKNENKPKRS